MEKMRTLHIIKETNDRYAWQTALKQQKKNPDRITILLLQDAVFTPIEGDFEVFACREDVVSRGVKTAATRTDYEEIVRMLMDADSVVCW